MKRFAMFLLLAIYAVTARAEKPFVFDVSNVVIGVHRIPTLLFLAGGKWSDAGDNLGMDSTRILCYKAFGFCEIAQAFNFNGNDAGVYRANEFCQYGNCMGLTFSAE